MFDDYVEHAGSTSQAPQTTLASAALGNVAYEGFEPGFEQEQDNLAYAGPSQPSIFSLGRVGYTPPSPITHLAASPVSLTLLLYPTTLLPIDLNNADILSPLQIPSTRKPGDFIAARLFGDPDGRHVLVSGEAGENFYFWNGGDPTRGKKVRPLKAIRGVVESVAWPRPPQSSSSSRGQSREVLLGSRAGTISSVTLDPSSELLFSADRHFTPLYSLPDKQPVLGLAAEYYKGEGGRVMGCVIAATVTRIYQFYGPIGTSAVGGWEDVFKSYRDGAPKFLELPSEMKYSELHLFFPSPQASPTRLAWLTGSGIYHSSLTFPPIAGSPGPIDGAQLCPYPTFILSGDQALTSSISNIPLSISLTEHHFILLYPQRVLAISVLEEHVTWEELLPLNSREKVIALAPEPARKTCWVYTDQSIFELLVKDEDRDVWRSYLSRGAHDVALKYAKTAAQRDYILASLADQHFSSGRFIPAAQCFAQAPLSRTFEEVTLKFVDAGERDALRYYLVARLERTRKADLTQRMLLATWLVEFYLSKCNELDDAIASHGGGADADASLNGVTGEELENLVTERQLLEDELKQFIETYKMNLDKKTTYELVLSHGRDDVFLHFATVISDWPRVLEHWVTEEDWSKAIEVLSRQNDLNLYYRYSSVLMRHAPKETVDAWLKQPALDPVRLITSLLQHPSRPGDSLSSNHAVRYLQNLVFDRQNTDSKIHNLLITFLATGPAQRPSSPMSSTTLDDPTSAALLQFLSTSPASPVTSLPYYDLDYALRLCKAHHLTSACVLIYSQMGLYENAVELALERGDIELARINADKPEDDDRLKKKLWLKIAKYVVQDKKDIKTAMKFIESTSLLSLDDILPFFPDFVLIDDFKETIISALESSSAHIEKLKAEMEEATRSAESIRTEIGALKNRFVTVERGERCARCGFGLLSRQFYVFPCMHAFHADCLIAQVKEFLPQHALRRILALQTALVHLSQPAQLRAPIPSQGQGPAQRALLSASFHPQNITKTLVNSPLALGSAGRKLLSSTLSAGEGLRDLIIPESLANAIGVWGGKGRAGKGAALQSDDEKIEKMKEELDELLAAECPLCAGVVVGLDKPFVEPGETDGSWEV